MNHRFGPTIFAVYVPAMEISKPTDQPFAGAGSKTAEPLGKRFSEARDSDGRLILKYRPASKFTDPWMEKVIKASETVWARREPLDGALWFDVAFFENRPRSHFYHRKSGDVLRPDAPAYPHQTDTHDYDKLRRAVCDSLTQAKVIVDDKRVVGGPGMKFYVEDGSVYGCVIRLGRMVAQTVADLGAVSPPPEGQESL